VNRNEFMPVLSEAGASVNASFAATSREGEARRRLNDLSVPSLLADALGAMIDPLRFDFYGARKLAGSVADCDRWLISIFL
jgi:hypothetical protein